MLTDEKETSVWQKRRRAWSSVAPVSFVRFCTFRPQRIKLLRADPFVWEVRTVKKWGNRRSNNQNSSEGREGSNERKKRKQSRKVHKQL